MKLIAMLVLVMLLTGCGTLISTFVPSLEHCNKVSYVREGNDFAVQAVCKVSP